MCPARQVKGGAGAAELELPSAWRETYLAANGVTFHAIEAGVAHAPVVLLLHGFPEFWFAWRRYVSPFAEAGFRVLALDERGYNLTSKPLGIPQYRTELLRQDIIAILDVLG